MIDITKPQLPCAFKTFPLSDSFDTVKDSKVTIPSPEEVSEARDWVNFKEM